MPNSQLLQRKVSFTHSYTQTTLITKLKMESSDELQSSIYVFNPVVTFDNYYNYELNLAITPLSGFTQKKITLSKNVVGTIF